MPKFSANLGYLFGEVEFLDRFEKAASAGFRAVEFHFPYDWDKNEIAERARRAGVEVVLLPPNSLRPPPTRVRSGAELT